MAEEGFFLPMAEEGFFLGLGPWPNVGTDMGLLVFSPHNSPSKSCCPAPRTEMRVLVSSGLCHGLPSLLLH